MNNFNFVFTIIKEHCAEAEIPSYKCFKEIEKTVNNNKVFLPVNLYLEILENMELIRYNKVSKTISITDKGISTPRLF